MLKQVQPEKIFGSVTTIQIAEALEKQGIVVDKRIIAIKDVMKRWYLQGVPETS